MIDTFILPWPARLLLGGRLKRASSVGLLGILPTRPLAAVCLGRVHDALDRVVRLDEPEHVGGLSKSPRAIGA
jgi:hypothetical protein